jgi:hypothetical protein
VVHNFRTCQRKPTDAVAQNQGRKRKRDNPTAEDLIAEIEDLEGVTGDDDAPDDGVIPEDVMVDDEEAEDVEVANFQWTEYGFPVPAARQLAAEGHQIRPPSQNLEELIVGPISKLLGKLVLIANWTISCYLLLKMSWKCS